MMMTMAEKEEVDIEEVTEEAVVDVAVAVATDKIAMNKEIDHTEKN